MSEQDREPHPILFPSSGVEELLRRLADRRPTQSRLDVGGAVARGGMGEILRVRDQDLGRDLAMKIVRRECAELDEGERQRILARFLEEAQVTGQLHHPSIVPVHELSVDADGNPFFTMPLIRGRDLSDIIRDVYHGRDGWTLARALGIVLKVCEALAYAHSRGVIHRDIKPSNVRIGRFGETYVMDWGLARVMGRKDTRDIRLRDPSVPLSTAVRTERSRLKEDTPDSPLVTMDGEVVGTPYYMSPEQARGETENIDARSDVYSVGALLYHLLAGRPPYAPLEGALSPRAVWARVLEGAPTDLRKQAPQAPVELIEICEKAMSRVASSRYQGAEELALDIEAFLDRRPVAAHAPSLAYAMRLAYGRNRSTIHWVAVAIAALGATSIWQVRGVRRAEAATTYARQLQNDGLVAAALVQAADTLYPATPANAARFQAWLDSANDLLAREGSYRLAASRADSVADSPERDILGSLSRLRSEQISVDRRFEASRSLRETSIVAQTEMWARVRDDLRVSNLYGHVELVPQEGLVPLWRNAQGLWEFWHVGSGTRPVAASPESCRPAPEDGLVLVLIPGAEALLGSPPEEHGRSESEPQRSVSVASFLLGKHEVTQAQWARVMGSNPSHYCPAVGLRITDTNPVESIDWDDAEKFVGRLALRLPTEEEWEWACRAGTTTPYYCGGSPECLRDHENILDRSQSGQAPMATAAWDDGFMMHAPIGSFLPNPYGLHDMLGNVSEWTSSIYRRDPTSDVAPVECQPRRTIRGGNYFLGLDLGGSAPLRCAYRMADDVRTPKRDRGFRVAASISP